VLYAHHLIYSSDSTSINYILNILNERTLCEPTLTYILGSRCRDGVVIISDRKVTLGFGDDFDYRDKLYGVLGHVVFGSSGSTDTYEFFRGYIMGLSVTKGIKLCEDMHLRSVFLLVL
jgi:hypothetical protein